MTARNVTASINLPNVAASIQRFRFENTQSVRCLRHLAGVPTSTFCFQPLKWKLNHPRQFASTRRNRREAGAFSTGVEATATEDSDEQSFVSQSRGAGGRAVRDPSLQRGWSLEERGVAAEESWRKKQRAPVEASNPRERFREEFDGQGENDRGRPPPGNSEPRARPEEGRVRQKVAPARTGGGARALGRGAGRWGAEGRLTGVQGRLAKKLQESGGGVAESQPRASRRVSGGTMGTEQSGRRVSSSDSAGNANGGDRTEGSTETDGGGSNGQRPAKGKKRERRDFIVKEQVSFAEPMSKDPQVAILGGGMAGIACALTLADYGIRSTLFDTGRHGLGGRMATRHVALDDGQTLSFDHAAQFFTASDPRFQSLVDTWLQKGLLQEWTGRVGVVRAGESFSELPAARRYVGPEGMRNFCDRLVVENPMITERRPVWISQLAPRGDRWHLSENEKSQGSFEAVVIAHNGKCANRLLAPTGLPALAAQMRRLQLSSVYALLAAFGEPLPVPPSWGGDSFGGAFVEGSPPLSWMGNNSSKLGLSNRPQCWTLLSSAEYGKKNKVPQESIPAARAARVKADLLGALGASLGLTPGALPNPIYLKLQLWGAALPLNAPGVECIFDPVGRVGICGDWLLAPCVEGAALSGMALAHQIVKFRNRKEEPVENFAIGLDTQFENVEAHDIGAFPGAATESASINTPPALAAA